MTVIVAPEAADEALSLLSGEGETAWLMGRIETGAGPVEYL